MEQSLLYLYLFPIHDQSCVRSLHAQFANQKLVSFPDPPLKRKGGSSEYSTSTHYGLALAMDTPKSYCLVSVNCRCAKLVCKGVTSEAS